MAGQRLTNVIKFLVGDGLSPEVFSNVGNIIDCNGPQFTNERIEVTDGDSPSNSKEYLAARQDPGPIQLTQNFNFDNSAHRQIFTDAQASPPTVRNYRTQYGDDTADYFGGAAFVGSFAPSGNTRGAALQAAISMQPSSVWTIAFG